MLDKNKIAVISTGNAGQSMAAYFSYLGFEVSLYARENERVEMFPENNVFTLGGVVSGSARVKEISDDMCKVISDAHLIMVTTPSQYHPIIAREMANCLEDGQIIILNPGRTFGCYVFNNTLKEYGNDKSVIVAEAETLMFACRVARIGEAHIFGIKDNVNLAALNPADTPKAVEAMSAVFPGRVKAATSTFQTSFSNIGMIFHPLPILLNITRVESREKFLFYRNGITHLVANILDRMDRERLAVARAFGVSVESAFDWLNTHYGAQGDTLYERIQNTEAYAHIDAPVDIDTRYIFEDIMTGCVPVYCAGEAIGVPTPIIKSSILWASTIYETDFIQNGRNQEAINFTEVINDARAIAKAQEDQ